MKNVKVSIKGTLTIIDYYSKKFMEEDNDYGFFSINYMKTCGWVYVKELFINDINFVNLAKEMGEYAITTDYFHNLFDDNWGHPLPVVAHVKVFSMEDNQLDYIISLEDDEEFDIKKVQLLKTDEIDDFQGFILADRILYDGKEIETIGNKDFDFEEILIDYSDYYEYEINGFANGK